MAAVSWRGRRVLVTGASGLVGSWLTRALLCEGAEVTVLLRDADPQSDLLRSGEIARCNVVGGRLEDVDVLERALVQARPQVLFHLGAQTQVVAALRQPLETFESNVRGTYVLLEACRRQRDLLEAIVVASSDKAYGEADTLPTTEDAPLRGTWPYDASKVCAEVIARCFAATFALPVAIARCGNVYGGGDLNWDRIVPGTIRSLLRGDRPVLRSDGSLVRDWLYVEDAAGAYLRLAEKAGDDGVRGEAFNFSMDSPLPVRALVEAIEDAVGVHLPPIVLGKADQEIRAQHLSSARARERLGWAPRFALAPALVETVAWYRRYLGVPESETGPGQAGA